MLSDGPSTLENTDHIRAAEKLLCEVRRRQDPRHRVLEAYVLIATKSKSNIDNALGMLIEIVNDGRGVITPSQSSTFHFFYASSQLS
jgi:hypothetical protein